jgi:hypothetical protein
MNKEQNGKMKNDKFGESKVSDYVDIDLLSVLKCTGLKGT